MWPAFLLGAALAVPAGVLLGSGMAGIAIVVIGGVSLAGPGLVIPLAKSFPGDSELAPLVGLEAVLPGDRVPPGGESPLAEGRPALWDSGGPQVGVGPAVASR